MSNHYHTVTARNTFAGMIVNLSDNVADLSVYPSHVHSIEHGETFHAEGCETCSIARLDLECLLLKLIMVEFAPDRFNTLMLVTSAGTFLIDADVKVKVLD